MLKFLTKKRENKNIHSLKNEQGQTLVIIVILMVVALMIGITVSSTFIQGLSILTASDDDAKAAAMAEALIERVLLIPSETLEDYIEFSSCGSDCYLEKTEDNGRVISATAALSYTGESEDSYDIKLAEEEANEIYLSGYTSGELIFVCWDGSYSIVSSYVYEDSGVVEANAYAYNAISTSHSDNNFDDAFSAYGYDNCFSFTASNTPKLLRLKSVYGEIDAAVIPEAGNSLPKQGILIESVGTAGKSKKTVTVIKSTPFLPAIFDYAVYQKSTSQTLSN